MRLALIFEWALSKAASNRAVEAVLTEGLCCQALLRQHKTLRIVNLGSTFQLLHKVEIPVLDSHDSSAMITQFIDTKIVDEEASASLKSLPVGHTYCWKLFRKSWSISASRPKSLKIFLKRPHAKISFGFWFRVTVDEYVPQPLQAAPIVSPYQPLGSRQFRTLKLMKGTISDPLKIQLQTQNIDNNMNFEALSYAWGGFNGYAAVSILQQDSTVIEYRVTQNLEIALRSLRLEHMDRVIWADAICINQADISERSHQVAMMGDIYRRADRVVIWLGDDTDGTSKGIEMLRHFIDTAGTKFQSPAYFTRSLIQTLAPYRTSTRGDTESQFSDDIQQSIQCVLSKPWFSRVWTVPEAVLSQRAVIQCGENTVEWTNDFQELRKIRVRVKSAVVSPHWKAIFQGKEVDLTPFLDLIEAQIREVALQKEIPIPEKDLLDIMYDFRHRQAADPRDKIYAMLGLAQSKRVQVKVDPDYAETVEDAYKKLDKALEELYGDLGL